MARAAKPAPRGRRHGTELEATRRAIQGAKAARWSAAEFYAGRGQFGKAVEVLTRPVPQPQASAETLAALEVERKRRFVGAIQLKPGAFEKAFNSLFGKGSNGSIPESLKEPKTNSRKRSR